MLCESFSTFRVQGKVLGLGWVSTSVAQVSGMTCYRIAPPSRKHCFINIESQSEENPIKCDFYITHYLNL